MDAVIEKLIQPGQTRTIKLEKFRVPVDCEQAGINITNCEVLAQFTTKAVPHTVRPTFSSQSVNGYLESYDAYVDDFKQALEALKHGDMTKYRTKYPTLIQRARDLQSKGEKLGGQLSPEDQGRFADYLNKRADELARLSQQPKQ